VSGVKATSIAGGADLAGSLGNLVQVRTVPSGHLPFNGSPIVVTVPPPPAGSSPSYVRYEVPWELWGRYGIPGGLVDQLRRTMQAPLLAGSASGVQAAALRAMLRFDAAVTPYIMYSHEFMNHYAMHIAVGMVIAALAARAWWIKYGEPTDPDEIAEQAAQRAFFGLTPVRPVGPPSGP
jgi:hypothetical protein